MAVEKKIITLDLFDEHYGNLDKIKQRILQVAALAYLVTGMKNHHIYSGLTGHYSKLVTNLLPQLKIDNNGKQVNYNEYILHLNRLFKEGYFARDYNQDFRLHDHLLYPICIIATNYDNVKTNLLIITKIDQFNIFPNFNNYRKFEFGNPLCLDYEDYRALNMLIHINNVKLSEQKWDNLEQQKVLLGYRTLFSQQIIEEEWFQSRLMYFQEILCVVKLSPALGYSYISDNEPDAKWFNKLKLLPQAQEHANFPLLTACLNQLNFVTLSHQTIIKQESSNNWAKNMLAATEYLLSGENKNALKFYDLSLREFSQITNRDYWFYVPEFSILYAIALIREKKHDKIVSVIVKRLEKQPNLAIFANLLHGIYSVINNDFNQAKSCFTLAIKYFSANGVSRLNCNIFALYLWLATLVAPNEIKWETVQHYLNKSHELSCYLAEVIMAELMAAHNKNYAKYLQLIADSFYHNLQVSSLVTIKPQWEYLVDKLDFLLGKTESSDDSALVVNGKRLVWLLDPKAPKVSVLEQTLRNNGQWTAGKEVALGRLFKKIDFEYLKPYDAQPISALVPDIYSPGRFKWDYNKLLIMLVGHPLVFDYDNPDLKLELVTESPVLDVKSVTNGYLVKLTPYSLNQTIYVNKLSPSKYQIIEFTKELVELSALLGANGSEVPRAAKQRLLDVVCRTTPTVKISADIIDDNLPEIVANSQCLIQLTPHGEGLALNVLVAPFGNGSYYFPAQGLANLVSKDNNNQHVKLVRDFKAELTSVKELIANCPIMEIAQQSKFEWLFESLEESLELLSELDEYRQKTNIIIEWPKGESIKFIANVGSGNMKIRVETKQQWFEYDGEVVIDGDDVLQLRGLLALLDNADSRFVQLDEGKFIALTQSFKRQLNELKLISENSKVFNLNSNVLAQVVDEAGEVEVDNKWHSHIQNIKRRNNFMPEIPATLQVELRDYQVEGFYYLSRLSNWQIGACLADDMGLGKTVQAIALLLEQGQSGASLVVAPTSVCFNWVEEIKRFAPTLQATLLHGANQREQSIQNASNNDVVICSYNLLQYESGLLASREWNLLILDEAQNIKNSTTKRFKAVCELNANRKVALSGTPIENHLGELWSIFRFLNPGLLGSLDKFQKKFITPIANKDQTARIALKNLVRPYILRRTKSQVLAELPPKIEQLIYIEPSTEELAFYDAIRKRALAKLANLNHDENKRFNILAEITRLRQACCHSTLVDENIKLENSKLGTFLELVQEIIANKHKVLVFSQYVGYLGVVKQLLVENNISFQYLDGAVALNQRKAAVDTFQSGKGGDVFLISLKAGGTGLNLTVADYVIILDPWWNPAVEDQAADRAHRMGQQRPVTVYRLIMKNSIEEKIINLHKDKRDLAGDLLEGQDIGGKLSVEDLLGLMQS